MWGLAENCFYLFSFKLTEKKIFLRFIFFIVQGAICSLPRPFQLGGGSPGILPPSPELMINQHWGVCWPQEPLTCCSETAILSADIKLFLPQPVSEHDAGQWHYLKQAYFKIQKWKWVMSKLFYFSKILCEKESKKGHTLMISLAAGTSSSKTTQAQNNKRFVEILYCIYITVVTKVPFCWTWSKHTIDRQLLHIHLCALDSLHEQKPSNKVPTQHTPFMMVTAGVSSLKASNCLAHLPAILIPQCTVKKDIEILTSDRSLSGMKHQQMRQIQSTCQAEKTCLWWAAVVATFGQIWMCQGQPGSSSLFKNKMNHWIWSHRSPSWWSFWKVLLDQMWNQTC